MARGPLPLVLGVTGHRDLRPDDVPSLERAVRAIFDELLVTYPTTPLLLLSPLAAGADRLVARVALDRGIPVVVPFPFAQPEYERDFDAAERAEFHDLLARPRALLPNARFCYFVGYVPAQEGITANDADNVREPERRGRQYAQLGSYIARNSHILIALWNGESSDAVGGTSQIVQFKLDGRAVGFGPEQRPLDRPEFGPVWQIVTPRSSAPDKLSGPAFSRVEHSAIADDDEPDAEVTRARRIEEFNADAVRAGYGTAQLTANKILEAAEGLAKQYQLRTLRTLRWLYVAGFLVSLAFVLYAHVWRHPSLLALNVVLTGAALAAYFFARNRQWQNRHLDYRALAEGLRVQEQWHAANVRETVADLYLRQHRAELDWIRSAIRASRLLDDTAHVDAVVPLEDRRRDLRMLRETWIVGERGQIGYFNGRSEVDERSEHRFGRATWAAAVASILCTVGAAIVFGLMGFEIKKEGAGEENVWWIAAIVAISLAAVASGLAASYAEKRAFGIHVKRYRRMRGIYQRAGAMLDSILAREPFKEKDYEAAQRVIRDVGEEALLENAAWVTLHRERPLEFVRGG